MLIPVKLKELGDIITGNTPSKKEISYWDSKDICFVKPNSISEQGISIVKNTTEYLSEKASSKARIVTKDAVFVTCIGTIGKIGLAAEGRYAFNQQINVVVPNTKVLPKYLAYALLSSKKRLEDIANAPVVPIINKTQFGEFSIKIEDNTLLQKDIVNILDKVVGIIDFRRKELQCLDNLVKARFVELFGDPKANDKGFTKAPMGEYMTVLTDFSSNGSYKTLDSGVTMYDEPNYAWMVRTTDLESGDMSSIKYIDENAYELLSKSKIYGGEIIMNKIGSAGKVYLMPEIEMPASLGRNAFMFRYDDRINVRFLFEQLVSEYGQAEIQQYVRGAVTKTITKDDARSVQIIVPEKELQDKYAEFVHQIDKSKVVVPSKIKNAIFAIMLSVSFGQITSI